MKTLLNVIARHGFILSNEIPAMEKECPKLLVVIKWAEKRRVKIPISTVAQTIKAGEKGTDYAREVFLDATTFQTLKESVERIKELI